MSLTYTTIASDLLEEVDNRYKFTLSVSDLAKRILDESRVNRHNDPFALANGEREERAMYQALIMKASEIDIGDGLIG
jgi:hypothetical protein